MAHFLDDGAPFPVVFPPFPLHCSCVTIWPAGPAMGSSFNETMWGVIGHTTGIEMRALNNLQWGPVARPGGLDGTWVGCPVAIHVWFTFHTSVLLCHSADPVLLFLHYWLPVQGCLLGAQSLTCEE
jgi:hypothetical protein